MTNKNPRRNAITAGAVGKVRRTQDILPSRLFQSQTAVGGNEQPKPPTLLDAALAYARRGWPVFPLHSIRDGQCTCGRDCGRDAGKHPRVAGGYKAATRNPGKIESWWRKWPDANIGIPTGALSGLVVVDIDGDAALASLRELESSHEPLPKTLTAKTARGWHFYFKHPHPDLIIPCTANAGIDIRGDGGYVVAPPSVHRTGHVYRWCTDAAP